VPDVYTGIMVVAATVVALILVIAGIAFVGLALFVLIVSLIETIREP
jgi:hypothetical protein